MGLAGPRGVVSLNTNSKYLFPNWWEMLSISSKGRRQSSRLNWWGGGLFQEESSTQVAVSRLIGSVERWEEL